MLANFLFWAEGLNLGNNIILREKTENIKNIWIKCFALPSEVLKVFIWYWFYVISSFFTNSLFFPICHWIEVSGFLSATRLVIFNLKTFFIITWGHFSIVFREGGREGRDRNISVREKHQLFASCTCPYLRWNPQPRYVPWLELNPQPFGYGMMLQPTEPHWPGLDQWVFKKSHGLWILS